MTDPTPSFSLRRAPARVACLFVLIAAAAPSARATARTFIGTWSGSTTDGGRILERRPGGGWDELTPAGGVGAVMDLAAHEGRLWAATGDGRVLRLEGADWVVELERAEPVVGLDEVGAVLHATTHRAVWRREAPGDWRRVATMSRPSRALASEGHDGRPMLYIGDDGDDSFWVLDPDALLACGDACPPSTGACPAGCFGGSCVYSMAEFDEGSGSLPFAGAYSGLLYDWDRSTRRFRRLPRLDGVGHVQALVSRDGRLFAGGLAGRLLSSATPSSGSWDLERVFGNDLPVSALAELDPDGELWVGHGGVPYGYARRDGRAALTIHDGTDWLDAPLPADAGRGVLAIAVLVEDGPRIGCDAGRYDPLECVGASTPLRLDGSGTELSPPGLAADFEWTGDFLEGSASGPAPTVHFEGPGLHELVLTVTAGGASESCATQVRVVDTRPPELRGVPADAVVSCDDLPAPARPEALDDCDAAAELRFEQREEAGACPQEREVVRTWTARDASGNETSATQRLRVVDEEAPILDGVPADARVACDAVPAPASPTARDACDPSPELGFEERRVDGACPGRHTLIRSWTATDACGNAARRVQTVEVVDETPPVVEAGGSDLLCLWPPAHGLACFRRADFEAFVRASDDCSEPIDWKLTGCASDQAEDGLGDGSTAPDCVVDPAGEWVCLRAERTGRQASGRRYAIAVVAADACGNESEETVVGFVHVPHDSRARPADCRRRPSLLVGRGDSLPF